MNFLSKIYEESRTKLENRLSILRAAFTVAESKGLINTNISLISQESGFDRNTIYRYYPNKDAVFCDLILYIQNDYLEQFTEDDFDLSKVKTGFEKVRIYHYKILEHFYTNNNSRMFNIMSEFDYIISHMDKNDPLFINHKKHLSTLPQASDVLIKLIDEGIEDNSIACGVDSETCCEILMQSTFSFFVRCENKKSIRPFFSKKSLYSFVEIMLNGIKNT